MIESSDVVCDTTIELVGTPYTGTCATCEFAYEITGEITAEAGSGCPEGYPGTWSTYLADETLPQVWLAFSSAGVVYGYYDRTNILWRGNLPGGVEVNWVPNVFDGSSWGSATYSKGVLDWTIEYDHELPTAPYAGTHIHTVGRGIVP